MEPSNFKRRGTGNDKPKLLTPAMAMASMFVRTMKDKARLGTVIRESEEKEEHEDLKAKPLSNCYIYTMILIFLFF